MSSPQSPRPPPLAPPKSFTIELAQELDGRWIADISSIPGVMTYGETREKAIAAAAALALRVIADRLEHGELPGAPFAVAFDAA